MGGSDVYGIDAWPVEGGFVAAGRVFRSVRYGKLLRPLQRPRPNSYEFSALYELKVLCKGVGNVAEAQNGPVEGVDEGGNFA